MGKRSPCQVMVAIEGCASCGHLAGVYKNGRKYGAHINQSGRYKHLGIYATPEEAALAYDRQEPGYMWALPLPLQ